MGGTDPTIRDKDRTVVLGLTAALVLVAMAGCIGLGDDDETPVETQSTPAGVTEATQALREAGFADPYLDVEPTGVVHEYEFWVDENVVLNPFGDREIWAVGFTEDPDEPGTVPGPEIRVKQGDTVRVTLHSPNTGFPGHTIHWHGVDVPWSSDGVPWTTQPIVGPEEEGTFTYEFVAKQAGTYWYHCVTSFPVDLDIGLFGALIVEPQDPEAELPYDREQTLIFHEMDSQWVTAAGYAINPDKDPNAGDLPSNPMDVADSLQNQARAGVDLGSSVVGGATGEYLFTQGPRDYYPEVSPRYKPHYDTFMINGKSYPNTDPVEIREGETVKLRFVNAGQNPRSIHLHGHHMLVTHNDGYPLPNPHWEDTIGLAAGERVDVLVTGTNPGIWSLHDHGGIPGSGTTSANDYAFPGGMKTVLTYEDFEPPGERAQPDGDDVTAGDLAVYAPSYRYR